MRIIRNILATFLLLGTFSAFSQTTLVVNTTSPAGPGSVSEALFIANSNSSVADPHEIVFTGLSIGDIISLSDGALPVSGDFITLNGDINGDFRPDITIRSQFGGLSGISISGSFNTIAYLNLTEFDGAPNAAIQIVDGTANLIKGNYLGTDLSGTGPAAGRNFRSISIEGGSDHIIGDGTPEGLNVLSFGTWGIYIANSNNNKVLGNYIGLDVTGQVGLGHSGPGIEIVDGSGNTIGGAPVVNVISGNNQNGIEINGGVGNQIIGNYIGMDNTGSIPVSNGRAGIVLASSSSGNTIQDNLISGNNSQGINLSNSSGDLIYGNLIGTDISGGADIGNNNFGIWIGTNSTNITIGDGTLARRNIISGNTNGIQISGGTNSILGNYIGTDISGSIAIANSGGGIVVSGGVNNQIGSGGAGNLISGNTYGIAVNVPNQTIYGNYIGTDESGTLPLPNTNQGIRLTGNATNVQVGGGLSPLNFNVISGNTQEGIIIDGVNVNSNFINENYIGVGSDGSTSLGNGGSGILIEGNANTNYVSKAIIANNGGDGIEVNGIFALGTSFNDFSSNSYYNNTGKAISIINGAQNGILPPTIIDNQSDGLVTGTASGGAFVEVYLDSEDEGEYLVGSTNADGSGNWSFTIDPVVVPPGLFYVTSVQSSNGITSEFSNAQFLNLLLTVVNTNDSGGGSLRWAIDNANNISGKDNIIFDIPNTDPGYTNNAGEEYWTIRPVIDLPQVTESIVIDATNQPGNGKYKIRLDGQNSIGTGINIGNGNTELYGLHVTRFTGTGIHLFYLGGGASTIGAPGKGNLSSGNDFGIRITLADNNIIQSNIIGLDETGTIAIPNRVGMSFPSNSSGNIIGGNNADERNIVSGNTTSAITINAGGGFDIINNYIGTDITGLVAIPNGHGLSIGTSGTNEIYNNVISGNNDNALHLSLVNGAIVQGNYIGVGADGMTPIGNNRGINIWGSTNSDNNVFGGIGPGEANIIANNTLQGVYLNTGNADFNQIIGNSIYCNGGLGIDLSLTGAIGNDGKPAPEITSVTLTTVSGTGIDGDIIHVYRDDSGCGPVQGGEYLGNVTVGGGVWSLGGLSLTGTEIVNATATDALGSTSQFAVDYPEIQVYQGADNTGTLITDDQVTSVDLGSGIVGNDLDGVFTIDNTSWVPLTISSIIAADTEFSIIGSPVTVAPMTSENFTVRLSVGANYGNYASSISIANDNPDKSSYDFPINGLITVDFVVTNTNDSGVGSLRFNIEAANAIPGYNEISFNIPTGDPGYNSTDQRWTITPLSDIPTLTEVAFIDADTQPGTAPFRIIIDGGSNPSLTRGLEIAADDSEIDGFYLRGFDASPVSSGVLISAGDRAIVGTFDGADGNLISGNTQGVRITAGQQHFIVTNWIGLDPSGTGAEPNFYGIWVDGTATNVQIGALGYTNHVSGNIEAGIWFQGIDNSSIMNNVIGLDITGLSPLPNLIGIVMNNTDVNSISDNTISGNNLEGIGLRSATNTSIFGNRIGVAVDGVTAAGNETGITCGDGGNTVNNTIGRLAPFSPNIIAHNTNYGILFDDVNYDFNTIAGNSIFCNGVLGIDLQGLGNDNIQPPTVTSVTATSISGTGIDGETIHIYKDNSGCTPLGADEYLGLATVSGGIWSLGGLTLASTDGINATATDTNGNTSQFAYSFGEISLFEGVDNSGVEIFDGQAGVVDLGSSMTGTDLVVDFTFENISGAPLEITDIQSTAPEITIINPPSSVDPFSLVTFSLQLSAATDGSFGATITILNSDEDEATFNFDVTGVITLPAPEITVFEGQDNLGTEIISGQLTAVDLGTGFYGNSLQTSVTIENTGMADLNISSIFVSDVPFEITNIPSLIPIGSTATFDISVDGLTSGDFLEDVTIINDDTDESSFVFPIFASIQPAGDIVVYEGFGISGPSIQSNQATPFDLGSSEITNDLLGNFSIQNNGNIDLNITSITSSNPEFTLSNIPTLIQFGTGNVAFIDISLSGSTAGIASTTITIVNDDPDQSTFVFDVIGEITAPSLRVFNGINSSGSEIFAFDNIDLGTTSLDTDLVADFVILNSGTSDLQVSSIQSDNIIYSISPSSMVLAPGSEMNFTLTLDASSAGIFDAQVTLTSNDISGATFNFDVTAEVLAPVITLRENSQSGGVIDENTPIDVGTVPRSTTLEKTFVIENVGNQILNIQTIIIDNPSFQVINAPTSINAGEFAEFTVVFSTEELGIQQGTVTITTDAGTFTFFVTANVVDIVLYNVLSPNGDGIHDFLKIENIEFFPTNTVYIYTRWGDALFKMDGYNNANNVFDGRANQGGISDVAEGTYYYVVVYEYTNNEGEAIQNTITGFFLIKRDL